MIDGERTGESSITTTVDVTVADGGLLEYLSDEPRSTGAGDFDDFLFFRAGDLLALTW